jgi:hypothetical protein
MGGINLAEQCKCVQVLAAKSISGGVTGIPFSMKGADHVSILIGFGAQGVAVPTAIQVLQATTQAAGTTSALASFRYYYQLLGGAGNDLLNGAAQGLSNDLGRPPNYTTSTAGITVFPTSVANLVYVIEIDAAELCIAGDTVGTITEYPYLQISITDSGNATFVSGWAILSGARVAYNIGASATV